MFVNFVFPQACRDFLDLAETHSRRWQRALQYEREQRTHLEETIEQLAKQHNSLERAWREAPTLVSTTPSAPTANKGETDHVLLTPAGFLWLKVMCNLRLYITDIPHVKEGHVKLCQKVLTLLLSTWTEGCVISTQSIHLFISLFINLKPTYS